MKKVTQKGIQETFLLTVKKYQPGVKLVITSLNTRDELPYYGGKNV